MKRLLSLLLLSAALLAHAGGPLPAPRYKPVLAGLPVLPDSGAEEDEAFRHMRVLSGHLLAPQAEDTRYLSVPPLRHTNHIYVADSFKTVAWDQHTINIYREDVTQLADTIRITVNDSLFPFTFPIKGVVTSGFGPRRLYGSSFHFGTDIRLKTGDKIVAAFDGIIRVVRYERGYGNFVVIAHPNGLETLYGHMSKVLVKSGQHVKSGEVIGLGGSTGRSTAPHLHFEFRFLGQQFNPERLLEFEDGEVLLSTVDIQSDWFHHLKELRRVRYHTIGRGDTLYGIARRYGTSVSYLCRMNGISSGTLLRLGARLRVR